MQVIWNEISEEERPKKYTDEFFSRFRKTDSIFPVITLVLYYGASGDWDGSLCIYDMFGENLSKDQKEKLRNYVSDYKINLVEMQKIQKLVANKEALSWLDLEARQVISEVMNVMNLEKYVRTENGKEVVDVCKAVQELIEKGRGAGREEGMRILIATSKEYGIPEETIKVKLVEKYKLTEQEAEEKYYMILKEEDNYKI